MCQKQATMHVEVLIAYTTVLKISRKYLISERCVKSLTFLQSTQKVC